ncbi:4-hydroxybenzoate polyprenyltransferase, mitochondrial, partial [Tetrabaena socialis]
KVLGASSLLLVGAYPLMKRITFWPQAFLGLTINWGALLGYAAVAGSPDWAVVLPLYGAGVCWTLVYDTIYAHQDKHDDVAAGVKSTALLLGSASKAWFAGFTTAAAGCLAAAGAAAGCGLPYAIGAAGMVGHMAWQVAAVDLEDGRDCAAKFASNKWAGGLLLGGIVADRLLAGL